MNREILISYAQAFTSFIFRTPGIKASKIKSVYLFGSVVRGDYDDDSDVDIFIDVDKKYEKEMMKFLNIALKNFYRSMECEKFQLLGVTNPIKAKWGDVKNWELFGSIKSEGIILYSSSIFPFFRKHFFLEIKPVKNIAKRNRIIRKLVGRKESFRKEKGLVDQIGGKILDSRHYIIPSEKIQYVTKILSKENAIFEIREMWME
ncbi:MAG: nucleotidyltransferase domain-containing protein [Candidatus Aenigmatarchaeota archaeon]